MTEAEWLACDSPVALLAHLNTDGYGRKPLLYACALRALRPKRLGQITLREWFVAVEAVLAGKAPANSLDRLQDDAEDECWRLAESGVLQSRAYHGVLYHAVACQWIHDPRELDVNFVLPRSAGLAELRRTAAGFVRDIFGNPFRTVKFRKRWRTDTTVSLARTMYDAGDFSAMPILADALQDAGCDDENIFAHCRDTSITHVRGCWVVDLVLGKS